MTMESMNVDTNTNNKGGGRTSSRGRGGGGRGRGGRGRGGRGRGGGRGSNNGSSSSNNNNNASTNNGDNPKKHHAGPSNSSDLTNKRPKRSNVCFQFAKTGSCERGDTCKFAHESPTAETTDDKNNSNNNNISKPVKVENSSNDVQMQDVPKKLAHITNDKFAALQISSESRRALAEVFKYECMTVVQSETLPLILQGDDILAKAKTGTGKTLAFMIPTIEKITSSRHQSSDICCLVISPTRELASQISTETEKLLTFHKSHFQKVVTCVGGTNKNKDLKALRGETPIVVATPGRLLDHLQNEGLAQRMVNLDSLILDEADQLLDMGFRPDIERILRILQPSKNTRQTLLFSATVPNSVSEIAGIALRPKYNYVDTVGEDAEQTHMHVQQQLLVAPQDQQIHALASILARETSQRPYKIMVFFTTARLTGFMAELFNSISQQTGYSVLEIHSRKNQKQREKSSDMFRKATNSVMFSSDVSARGMDYPDVTFVLQIGLTDRAQYIHRLGRTARAGKSGKGALLLAPYEEGYMARKELKDMPLEPIAIPNIPKVDECVASALRNVSKIESLDVSAQQAYRAWLGYYNSHVRKIGWDKKQLVAQANDWAKANGLREQPKLQKKTVGKMGLKGVPGLKLE